MSPKNSKNIFSIPLDETFKILTNTSPDCIKLFDLNNKVIYMNPGGLREHRFNTLEDAVGFDWTKSVVSRQHEEIKKVIAESIQKKIPVTLDVEHVPEYATNRWCSMTINPVFGPEGRAKYFIGVSRDITSRKEESRALKQHALEDEATIESLGEGMIATDHAGMITIVNSEAKNILGRTSEDLVGKLFVDAIPMLDEHDQRVPPEARDVTRALLENTSIRQKPVRYVRGNGKIVPVKTTMTPIVIDEETIGTVVVFYDMTKELEIEKTRLDLLSLASHQLRTPLSGTKWLIETLKKGIFGKLNQKQSEYIDEIYKTNERMTGLVSDMLSALRIESGMESFERKETTALSIFNVVHASLGSAALAKQINLVYQGDVDAPFVTAPELLRNILESFVSNAIIYSPTQTKIIIRVEKHDGRMVFFVKDSGIGIPEDEQDHIFERFYRASNAKTVNTRGTGLGLYMAAMLAEKIGAKLSFESTLDGGSIFFLEFPLRLEGSK